MVGVKSFAYLSKELARSIVMQIAIITFSSEILRKEIKEVIERIGYVIYSTCAYQIK